MTTTRQIIAKQVKEAREKKGWTQAEVAQKVGSITPNYLAMIERAEANASLEKLDKIGKVLGITFMI